PRFALEHPIPYHLCSQQETSSAVLPTLVAGLDRLSPAYQQTHRLFGFPGDWSFPSLGQTVASAYLSPERSFQGRYRNSSRQISCPPVAERQWLFAAPRSTPPGRPVFWPLPPKASHP